MKRRIRLIVRECLSSRQGNSPRVWHVGYWDNSCKSSDPDMRFRSFGCRSTEKEAIALAVDMAAKRSREFIF